MKKISEGIYQHGKRGNHSVRLRIPAALRSVYPSKQTHIRRNLRTGDASLAKSRGRVVIGCIEAEFTDKRQKLELTRASQTPKRVTTLSDEQIKAVAEYWAHNVLAQDEARRQNGLEGGVPGPRSAAWRPARGAGRFTRPRQDRGDLPSPAQLFVYVWRRLREHSHAF